MLLLVNGTVTITRQNENHATIAVLVGADANLQGDNNGSMISSPWYQPSMDSELGTVQFANWSLLIGGPDENPSYEPRPGDRITFMPTNPNSKRAGIYRQVAANTGEEDEDGDLSYWDLPVCKVISKRTA